MIIILIAGIIALLFGRIKITKKWDLKGKFARLFGLSLLTLAFPIGSLLATFLITFSPRLAFSDGITKVLLDFICSILIVAIIAYPFILWQSNSSKSETSKTLDKKITTFLIITLGAILWFYLYGLYFGVTSIKNILNKQEEGEKEGISQGKGKTFDECLKLFVSKHPIKTLGEIKPDTDFNLYLDESLKANGFLTGCIQTSSDHESLCNSIPTEHNSTEQKDWYLEKCKYLNIHPNDCNTVLSGALISACSLAKLNSIKH